MKNFVTKISLIGIIGILFPLVANAKGDTWFNSNYECYVDADNNNWYWFCGNQTESCSGSKPSGNNRVFRQRHGDVLDYGSSGHWFCCGGTDSKTGKYVKGDNWIVKEIEETKTITDDAANPIGKCTWTKKINVCDYAANPDDPAADNPEDECFDATDSVCGDGMVYRKSVNGCVTACSNGYAFSGETTNDCVLINKNDPRQGIVDDYVVRCADDRLWDDNKLECFIPKAKEQISPLMFRKCWKCTDSFSLKTCLLTYSSGETINDEKTKKNCDISD